MKTLVGRYRLYYAIGAGGTGIVWRARDLRLERMVAVKEIRFPATLPAAERAGLTARAADEARAAARLEHPNIVAVHDVVVDDDHPWIVMRLIEGRSLDQLVRNDGPVSPAEAARIGLSLLDALDAAHAAGIVHRDVKPANVMVQPDGHVLLTDFSTAAGIPLGSPGYVAPERLSTGPAGPPADYFSLGTTLYFAVEGRHPFEAAGDSPAGHSAAATEPHSTPEHAGPLAATLDGLLAKDPQSRLLGDAARASLLAAANLQAPAVVPQPHRDAEPQPIPEPVEAPEVDAAGPLPAASATPAAGDGDEPSEDRPPARGGWSPRTVALVGSGVLVLLIAIGVLGRGGNAPGEAEGPAAPLVAASTSGSPSPSASPTGSPPVTEVAAGMATRPSSTRTTTRPPTKAAATTSTKISTDPPSYNGFCAGGGLDLKITVTIGVSQPGAAVKFSVSGVGTFSGNATGNAYTATYPVHVTNARKNVFRYALNVTAPSTASDTATFRDDCVTYGR